MRSPIEGSACRTALRTTLQPFCMPAVEVQNLALGGCIEPT